VRYSITSLISAGNLVSRRTEGEPHDAAEELAFVSEHDISKVTPGDIVFLISVRWVNGWLVSIRTTHTGHDQNI
jgi:hypothetical protein